MNAGKSTHEKQSEAGKKGADARWTRAKRVKLKSLEKTQFYKHRNLYQKEAEERGEEGYHIDPATHEKLSEAGKKGSAARSAKKMVSVYVVVFKFCRYLYFIPF